MTLIGKLAVAELTLSRAVKHIAQQHGVSIDDTIFIASLSPEAEAYRILGKLRDDIRRELWVKPAARTSEVETTEVARR